MEDRLAAQRDEPARQDRLNRQHFARVVAQRLVEVNRHQQAATQDEDRAFVVHLDGAWGSGKSTVLGFVVAALPPDWLIVRYNAWRDETTLPPWWGIMAQLKAQVLRQARGPARWKVSGTWLGWRLRSHWLAAVLAVALLAASIFIFLQTTIDMTKIAGLVTAAGAAFALLRVLLLGSSRSAEAIRALGDDPYAPVIETYAKLVRRAGAPLLVIIDDIDRCDAPNVVQLLESIQTTLRGAPVTYLVAGDRRWITTAFEKVYDDFCTPMGTHGRSLGHLFLDKVFQLSVAIPRMSQGLLDTYWNALLRGEAPASEGAREDAVEEAAQRIGGAISPEALQQAIEVAEADADSAVQMAVRGAAALRIASPAASTVLEHRFAPLTPLLERNPRALRRLINALGVSQAVLFLEGRKIDPLLLARWTVLELRWPQLADALVRHPAWLDTPDMAEQPWRDLLGNRDVRLVIAGDPAGISLTAATLQELFGDPATVAAADQAAAPPVAA